MSPDIFPKCFQESKREQCVLYFLSLRKRLQFQFHYLKCFCLTLERVAQLVKALQPSKNVPSLGAHRALDQTHSHNLIKKLEVALPLNFLTIEDVTLSVVPSFSWDHQMVR